MTTCVALLRAVNVAGHQPVAMADLRRLMGDLGFGDAQSLLQSGNLVFGGATGGTARLEERLEREMTARLGLVTDVMVRTAAEWRALVAANPFRAEAERDPARLVVAFLKEPTSAKAVAALRAAIVGRERAMGREERGRRRDAGRRACRPTG